MRENRFDDDAAYWHRAAFVTPFSLMNSAWATVEELELSLAPGHPVEMDPGITLRARHGMRMLVRPAERGA